jgi:hypothetical protein
MLDEKISDLDILLQWTRMGDHLKASTTEGTLLYSSVTNFVSDLLSPRQAKWIKEDYEKKRKKYVFAN